MNIKCNKCGKSVEFGSDVCPYCDYYICDSTTLIIDDSVTEIKGGTKGGPFEQNPVYPLGYDRIIVPDSVTSIGLSAFCGATYLKSISLPENSLTEIGEAAFQWCTSLKSIIIPEGVTKIGYMAFYECESLTSVILPTTLKEIGGKAFYGCSSLENLYIPSRYGVTIAEDAFECPRYTKSSHKNMDDDFWV